MFVSLDWQLWYLLADPGSVYWVNVRCTTGLKEALISRKVVCKEVQRGEDSVPTSKEK